MSALFDYFKDSHMQEALDRFWEVLEDRTRMKSGYYGEEKFNLT